MNNSIDKLKRIKVDCLYGKKKHFNAADRNHAYHYQIGVPLIVVNILTGSVIFYVLTDGTTNWIKYVPLILALIAAILSGFQTYFNLPSRVEGHRRLGNRYLAVMKKCDRMLGYITDGVIKEDSLIERIETIALEVDDINTEAEAFPTTKEDYFLAKKGIESGEENYTEQELNI